MKAASQVYQVGIVTLIVFIFMPLASVVPGGAVQSQRILSIIVTAARLDMIQLILSAISAIRDRGYLSAA